MCRVRRLRRPKEYARHEYPLVQIQRSVTGTACGVHPLLQHGHAVRDCRERQLLQT